MAFKIFGETELLRYPIRLRRTWGMNEALDAELAKLSPKPKNCCLRVEYSDFHTNSAKKTKTSAFQAYVAAKNTKASGKMHYRCFTMENEKEGWIILRDR